MRAAWQSLRMRVLLVVVAVVVAPLVLVGSSDIFDRVAEERLGAETDAAALETASALATSADGLLAVDAVALDHGAWIRVLGPDGSVVLEADHARAGVFAGWLGEVADDPEPTLVAWDAARGPLARREEVDVAAAVAHGHLCTGDLNGLVVCASALSVPPRTIHVEKASWRALSSLRQERAPMVALTLYVLVFGLAIGVWVGRRMVRPIEMLRDQVAARRSRPGDLAPFELERDDEIGDLARVVNELLGALDARNRANAAFIADLAHELKNPVAAVRAVSEAMERPVDPERAERLSRVLADSSRRLDALVSRFLEIARAEAGLPDQTREPVDVGALVAGLVDAFRRDERFAGVTFAANVVPAEVDGVAERLETALRNLLDNAASFAGARGRVDVRMRLEAGEVAVAIADSGPGIAPEHLPRMFERFFTTRREQRGTGLGLPLVRAIVVAHGGGVDASSGAGAVFTIRLPLRAR